MNQQAFRLLAAILVILTVPLTATAEIELYLVDPTGDTQKAEIAPGESFTIQAGLGTTQALVGVSYWLNISDNGSGRFYLSERVVEAISPFSDLITANTAVVEPGAALLDPYNDRDLGALTNDALLPAPPGVYPLAMYTIGSTPDVPPGTYTLTVVGGVGVDTEFNELPITVHAYTVVVTDPGATDSGGGDTGSDPGNTGNDPGHSDDPDPSDTTNPDKTTDDSTGNGGDTSTGTDGSTGGSDGGADTDLQDAAENHSAGEHTIDRTIVPTCGQGSASALWAMACLWLLRPGERPRK